MLNEYVPPALYSDTVALADVFQPTNSYPVFTGILLLSFILALVVLLYIVIVCAIGALTPPFALYVIVISFFQIAYNTVLSLNEYVPPALYSDTVALADVFQPTNSYPVFTGILLLSFILALVVLLYIVIVCAIGAPVPPFALYVIVISFFQIAYNVTFPLFIAVRFFITCESVYVAIVASLFSLQPKNS